MQKYYKRKNFISGLVNLKFFKVRGTVPDRYNRFRDASNRELQESSLL